MSDLLGPPERVGRDGAARLRFERRGAATVLTGCRWRVPLQVLAPVALEDRAAVVSLLNPTGGIVGGDRLTIEVAVGPGAHACLTTPSATKVYRTAGPLAEQRVDLHLGADAALEWVPDHTIPFAGAAFRQSIRATLAPGARLILVDAFAAGRLARGEAWRFARLELELGVRDGRGWLVLDRAVLAGGGPWDGLGFAEGAGYVATVVIVGALDPAALDPATADAGVRVALAPLPRGGVLARVLAADAPGLLGTLAGLWARARAALLGAPPLELRKP